MMSGIFGMFQGIWLSSQRIVTKPSSLRPWEKRAPQAGELWVPGFLRMSSGWDSLLSKEYVWIHTYLSLYGCCPVIKSTFLSWHPFSLQERRIWGVALPSDVIKNFIYYCRIERQSNFITFFIWETHVNNYNNNKLYFYLNMPYILTYSAAYFIQ